MSRRVLAVVLTLLVIVSSAAALMPHSSSSSSAASPAAKPVVAGSAATPKPGDYLEYDFLNGYGDYSGGYYYLGELGYDTLNFWVYDPFDLDVNFTLTDLNATRDGVGNPAWHVEVAVSNTTYQYYSYQHGVSYTFPNLPFGGTWNVTVEAPLAGWYNTTITLEKYYASASSSISYGQSGLPGEAYSVFWWAYLDSNEYTLYTGATSVRAVGHYWGNGTYQNLFSDGITNLTVGSWGQWSSTIPLNATPDEYIEIDIWIITSAGGMVAENETTDLYIEVGSLWVYESGISPYPAYCEDDHYYYIPVGATTAACIEVGSDFYDQFTPIAGLPVTISYWNGTRNITQAGAPTSATTDASGDAIITFNATAPFINEFQNPYYDSVNFTVTVPGADGTGYQWTAWTNLTWVISPYSTASGIVNVALDHTQYYSGATATVTWSISSSDTAVTGTISADNWIVEDWDNDNIVWATGSLSTTAQSGTFTFPITSAMVNDEIIVWVYASNTTLGFEGYASAYVVTPSLLLTGSGYYTEGSTWTVGAALNGSAAAPAGTSIVWQAWGVWSGYETEALISSGTVSNGGTISVAISSSSPAQYVYIDAWAEANGQILTTSSTQGALEMGYSVQLGVGTQSSYTDGSFQPGQTVTLDYSLTPIDGTALPQYVEFTLSAMGFAYSQTFSGAPSGTVSFTVPSSAKSGLLILELDVDNSGYLTAGNCVGTGGCSAITALLINTNPGALNMQLGAGSGITVAWVILLVIVIIVAIALYVALRRRGGSSSAPSGGSGLNAPAPAPSTPPATAWQEPPPGATGSQPPLPPPSGSS